jgi:hypothetical protein
VTRDDELAGCCRPRSAPTPWRAFARGLTFRPHVVRMDSVFLDAQRFEAGDDVGWEKGSGLFSRNGPEARGKRVQGKLDDKATGFPSLV